MERKRIRNGLEIGNGNGNRNQNGNGIYLPISNPFLIHFLSIFGILISVPYCICFYL